MANKSSFLLAVLFIANPFVLLFYQNCSSAPHQRASYYQNTSYQPTYQNKSRSISSVETPTKEDVKPSY